MKPASKVFFFFQFVLLTLLACFTIQPAAQAQPVQPPAVPVRVAVLLPLNLDSLYRGTQYRYDNSIPRWVLPALEFYHGVEMAADSLRQDGIPADIRVVDTRKNGSLSQALADPVLQQVEMIIGMAQSTGDLRQMADFAKTLNIPFISATYPNDGGVSGNPNMVLLNTTLKTHCEGLYRYLQSNHATDKLTVITRKGNVEGFIKGWLEEAAANTRSVKLDWKIVTVPDSFSASQLQVWLDSNRTNTLIGASLDRTFGLRLLQTLASLSPAYNATVFGMPTWDEYQLSRPEFKGSTVMFSTPFVSYSANAALYNHIHKHYSQIVNSKPSDMAFKGFEITYRFTKTLAMHRGTAAFMESINSREAKIFSDFNILPVYQQDGTVQYRENKKLYFVKKVDGITMGVYQ